MTTLADRIPTLSDADLKALRINATRLLESGSPVQQSTAAEIIPLIDAEAATRLANKPAAVKKPRAPAKKKVAPAAGHQTALSEEPA